MKIVTWIKICGITNLEDALRAAELGADALGFVFYPRSPRCVNKEMAKEIIESLPKEVIKVGVFVDEVAEEVREIASYCGLGMLQFHGNEPPDYCRGFGQRVIKAFRVKNKESLIDLPKYEVDYYLLDAYGETLPGGTGRTFNWDLAEEAKEFGRPVILSGGLTPDNVISAIKKIVPFGVDVSSGVEVSPGKKDHKKLQEFIQKVKAMG